LFYQELELNSPKGCGAKKHQLAFCFADMVTEIDVRLEGPGAFEFD